MKLGWLLRSVVGKLWMTIIVLVAVVLLILGMFLLQYIDINFQDTTSHQVKVLFIVTGIIGFMLSTFFAFFLSSKITQPLIEMKKAAASISGGDYETRVPIRSTDEIGDLAHAFNRMANDLDSLIKDLSLEKNHLASILRSMSDAVMTFDAEGNVTMSNPPGDKLMAHWNSLDWAEDEENISRPGVPKPLFELFGHVITEGVDTSDKIHFLSGVWSVVMAPLKSNDSVRGAVAVVRDVTEEFKLEKLRRDFVANVSHEIRTPLSMLQGYSEALLDGFADSPEERDELVQVIHDESVRMGRLVKDLLDLARMEAGHNELKLMPCDIDSLVRRVHRKFAAYAKDRDIRLSCELPESPPLNVEAADEDRLEQVLTNLLDNAMRHTPSGATISLSGDWGVPDPGQTDPAYVVLRIADEGEGIPSDDLPYIFERFYKADKSRKRGSSGGTGLGLAIVKNIVEGHHGRIQVDSLIGKGTTFTILLPVDLNHQLSKRSS
ncbi:two-component system sensor histidine kinase ResE [Paenibacillus cellulosilyticus]|uniref:histidine kinase n=1 Tax=Paenibacillus cellulosilyticus TaxID=375489 RepID=A0A2V2YW44_9BACL|nr:ATP-binding protein [Paenibacillus cellulosilyticus]PWW05586.1 two-component system sensor histidine kinase ResE [Paenibacillus cellulosilyticus]QKS45381.1 HAMP domain-containing protein [Paenibacillus cellulosilyticus]